MVLKNHLNLKITNGMNRTITLSVLVVFKKIVFHKNSFGELLSEKIVDK